MFRQTTLFFLPSSQLQTTVQDSHKKILDGVFKAVDKAALLYGQTLTDREMDEKRRLESWLEEKMGIALDSKDLSKVQEVLRQLFNGWHWTFGGFNEISFKGQLLTGLIAEFGGNKTSVAYDPEWACQYLEYIFGEYRVELTALSSRENASKSTNASKPVDVLIECPILQKEAPSYHGSFFPEYSTITSVVKTCINGLARPPAI